tara:strand:- start:53 stop:205 length:153 start_codon:yes stop_codon:yes gene_type:complete
MLINLTLMSFDEDTPEVTRTKRELELIVLVVPPDATVYEPIEGLTSLSKH